MTIHFNTPPVHGGICAKRTNLAELRVLAAALVVIGRVSRPVCLSQLA